MPSPNLKAASIGIFDSGFGGLTVMKAIRELMPYENIIYLGDTAHLPYGSKSSETILSYSLENAHFLVKQGIKILVIACNTACCSALEEIRSCVPVPVIGITEQAIEEVTIRYPQSKVGILATAATISSGVYQAQLLKKAPDMQLFPLSCPLFVSLVEEGYTDHPLSKLIAHEYLAPLKEQHIDAALLGCTHFPWLYSIIQATLGNCVTLIDPASACAQETQRSLKELTQLNDSLTPPFYQFFASGDPEKFRLLGQTLFNEPIPHVFHKTPEFYELQKTSFTD